MEQPKLPVVIVEWLDAVDWETPISLSEISTRHRPETVYSMGWLLREDEAGVLIAGEYYDEMYRRMEFIPRVNIKSVTHFKLTKPRKSRRKGSGPQDGRSAAPRGSRSSDPDPTPAAS